MEDVQGQPDTRQLPINQVGVKDLRYPIVVFDKLRDKQETVGTFALSVNLPHQFKGTHMSRFVEVIEACQSEITLRMLPQLLHMLRTRLTATSAKVEINFPYFLGKKAPVSGSHARMDYECRFLGEAKAEKLKLVLGVRVPVTSLCPCSKTISDYGAHNQRALVDIELSTYYDEKAEPHIVWIEDIVALAEQSASAPVYPLLKREDERFLTMKAYDNPTFVEDIVRNAALSLKENPLISWFGVHVTSQESIHNHSAFACLEWSREL